MNAGGLHYLEGDATYPQGSGNKMIVHICNDKGGWGRGFVRSLSKRWYLPEREYREWHRAHHRNQLKHTVPPFELNQVQFVRVEPDICVANMIAQAGYRKHASVPPIRYRALEKCLVTLDFYMRDWGGSIHMPRIGCGLAGGTWDRVEPLILRHLVERGHFVSVYDLPTRE